MSLKRLPRVSGLGVNSVLVGFVRVAQSSLVVETSMLQTLLVKGVVQTLGLQYFNAEILLKGQCPDYAHA